MSALFTINLEPDFEVKKNHPYTICFKATCCTVYTFEPFDIEYTGTELNYKIGLKEAYRDIILKKIKKVFGYGPFEKEKIRYALNDNYCFQVKSDDVKC